MKFKLLLLGLMFTSILLKAQEPYTSLIFSEVRMDAAHHAYVELCNMGNVAVDLGQFEVGNLSPFTTNPDLTYPNGNEKLMLPPRMLNPGETFVIANVAEWGDEQALLNIEKQGSWTKKDTWRIADMQLHVSEAPGGDPTDSVSVGANALTCWNGDYCFFLRHFYKEGDSLVVDAVNGIFTSETGSRPNGYGPSDVAGVPDATASHILVRKSGIKKGNTDWEQARGVDLDDSEWLPIPTLVAGGWEMGRKEFWTLGNHGDFKLDKNTLKSKTIETDWNAKTMKVAWGVRNEDSIMNEFDFMPGIAWKYYMAATKADSFFTSVRTGDSLTLFACGNQLIIEKFALIALAPVASEARVIPKRANDRGNWYTPYIVSENIPGMDTISNVGFATRVDSLFKYLEKPQAATWEIVWKDNTKRPDLINGDILKVTAEDGKTTKQYFIKVRPYIPSHNANLASITWPDIPEFYKGIFGWKGDTIPNFAPTKYNYVVQIPLEAKGVAALIARPENVDTKVEVKRATTLYGSEENRTLVFSTLAEDDTTDLQYFVKLEKEKDLTNVQPNSMEPFISQWVYRADYQQVFIEICNPGNQPLDLSKYCIVRSEALNPAQAIAVSSGVGDFGSRFNRYVPGYIWQDETQWTIQPGILEKDFSVSSIVEGGDVFVLAFALPAYRGGSTAEYPEWKEIDVNFRKAYNPWGIEFAEDELANYNNVCGGWFASGGDLILYKITNDSIFNKLKPLNDPNDVEVIDVLGRCTANTGFGLIDGLTHDQNSGMIRRPQYYRGNPVPGASLGTGEPGTSEWIYKSHVEYAAEGYPWPINNSMNSNGVGSHEMVTVTEFMSTVNSGAYKVSDGYSMNETISGGVQTGITVDQFLDNIIMADKNQTLTITSGGVIISGNDKLKDGDLLTVVSANKANTSQYKISVTPQGLDNNALLTSKVYTIKVNGATGTITGFDSGTSLETVFNNVTPPANSSLFGAYNADGSYATFTSMYPDTNYYENIATNQIFFEVIAQDGKTRIDYQLIPNSKATDAYVSSSIYEVDQKTAMIKLVTDGINVQSFYNRLVPAPGATMVLLNKMDQERVLGTIYEDDVLVVTAQDGVTKKVYTLEFYSDYAARYEANLYSDVYAVSFQAKRIRNVYSNVTVSEFINNIWVPLGATYVLLDASGKPKSEGLMKDNDQIVVTSENGLVVIIFKVTTKKTGVISVNGSSIKMYPNPTTGFINISGIENGNTIRIFNTLGQNIKTIVADSDQITTTINEYPSGIYMVTVNNGRNNIANVRFIKN